jgi:hypothetical protein
MKKRRNGRYCNTGRYCGNGEQKRNDVILVH